MFSFFRSSSTQINKTHDLQTENTVLRKQLDELIREHTNKIQSLTKENNDLHKKVETLAKECEIYQSLMYTRK